MVPIYKTAWAELQRQGARVSQVQAFSEQVQHFCGGRGSKKPCPCPQHKSKQHVVARAHANAARSTAATHAARLTAAQKRHESAVNAYGQKPTEVAAKRLAAAKAYLESRQEAHAQAQKEARRQETKATRMERQAGKKPPLPVSKKPEEKPEVKKDTGPVKIDYVPPATPDVIDKAAPIHERLVQYKDGDAKVAALANIQDRLDYHEGKIKETQAVMDKFWADRKASGVKNLYKLGKKDQARLDALNEENLEAQRQSNRARSERLAAMSMIFSAPYPDPVSHQIDETVHSFNDKQHQAISEAHAFLAKTLARKPGGPMKSVKIVPLNPAAGNQRAFYMGRSIFVKAEPPYNQTGTVVHEFGHHIQYEMPGVHEATMEFLAHRVGDEQPANLLQLFPESRYDAHEMGRKDHFDRYFDASSAHYCGRDSGPHSSEIVSMGLQALYEDPAKFAQKDPEYAKLILGLLDGKLRK